MPICYSLVGMRRSRRRSEQHKPFLSPPPLSQPYLAGRVHLVLDKAGAREMVQAAFESPVSYVGIDTEYRFAEDQPTRLRGGKVTWHDIRSIRPFCIAFAIASSGRMLRFVVDLRINDLLPMVQEVLDLPAAFVSHYAKAELFTVWSLGLRKPRILWDTLLAERALHLGGCPLRARARRAESVEEAVRLKQDATAMADESLSLDATAARYGIVIPRFGAKAALQSSFLTKPLDAPLTQAEAEYCAADAQATAEIRGPQRRCLRSGRHLRNTRRCRDALECHGSGDRVDWGPLRP